MHPLRTVVAVSLAIALAAVPGAAAAGSPAQVGPPAPGSSSSEPLSDTAAGAVVTLVTGDRVTVTADTGGRSGLVVDPAPREGYQPGFDAVTEDGDVYVFPTDAGQLVPAVLDRELFNVSKLAAAGYTDGVPVIVTHQPDQSGAGPAPLAAPAGLEVTTALPSIDGVAGTIAPDGAWWSATAPDPAGLRSLAAGPATGRALAAGPLAGVAKVWLDGPVEPALAESVPQVGAPAAWDAGFDGTGRTVAVLDTGIDPDHPDLAGRVAAQENFTTSDTAVDRHGHGTHVAGIVAGSGSASDGTYVGVAPGAELLSGKVLNDFGFGQLSWIIAGMEWAAASGADVVNMSLGSGPTDGTDPVSLALNRISAEHDLLFVVAAGNSGPGAETVEAPGSADAALTVGNVTKSEQLAIDSSRGPRLGDSAVKPEITAPGTDIVSARAAGTSLGFPLNDHYTRLGGTSMAAPHVAGAAALALQQRPGLGAPDLKAALVSTATPNPDLDVFEQGAGRLDLARLIDTPVHAAPATLNYGVFPFPHDDTAPAQRTVSYTNRTEAPATLALSAEATSRSGEVAPAAMLSVDPPSVTLAPGESTDVTVTVDLRHGEIGRYGGNLLAAAGGVLTRTPLSFHKEEELHQLTLRGIARNGEPAIFNSSLDIVNVDGSADLAEHVLRFDNNGEIHLRLPPGVYSATAWIDTYLSNELQEQETTVVSEPEFELAGDTTVVLDGRPAVELTVATPAHPDAVRHRFTFGHLRRGVGGSEISRLGLRAEWPRVFMVPTPPATIGEHEFFSHLRMGEPPLVLDVPGLALTYPALFFVDSPVVEFDLARPVVDAGLGTPEELAAAGAEDAIVLVRRGGPSFFQLGANAAAAGAAALLVANDRPGQIANFGIGSDADMPAIRLSQEDGDALQARLAEGEVTARLIGQRSTDYLYELVLPESNGIPSDLSYLAEPGTLATVDNAFHSDPARLLGEEFREHFRPWQQFSVVFNNDLVLPHRRTEYLSGHDSRWRQRVLMPDNGSLREYLTSYAPGEQRERSWWGQVLRPGVRLGSPQEAARPARRDGDTLVLELAEWMDAHGNWGNPAFVDTTAFRLFADGELVAETARPRGEFPISPDPAEYRLELDVARDADWRETSTATSTVWTVQSARPAVAALGSPAAMTAGSAPQAPLRPLADGSEVLPLLLVDYQADLDLRNTAPHPADRRGPAAVELRVHHQPGADGPPVARARAWISYDDGQTWQLRPTLRVGDGRYRVILPSRDPADGSGFVSIRVAAWDTGGNRIEQAINRAWRLGPRNGERR